jgi:hypothetical protein
MVPPQEGFQHRAQVAYTVTALGAQVKDENRLPVDFAGGIFTFRTNQLASLIRSGIGAVPSGAFSILGHASGGLWRGAIAGTISATTSDGAVASPEPHFGNAEALANLCARMPLLHGRIGL